MRVALMGTRGVPATYGGFETAVEEIGAGLSSLGHAVTVYCRTGSTAEDSYRGMRRVVLPAVHRTALETFTHTGLSTAHVLRERPDAAIVFNAANAPFVAILRRAGIPVALHIDGHDARRAKWRGAGSRYYSVATRIGCRYASEVVVDSAAMRAELQASHALAARHIAYGAKRSELATSALHEQLAGAGLTPRGYHLVVARFEPENHVLEIIAAYQASSAELPLLVVGFAGFPSAYARAISEQVAGDRRVRLTGAIWDQDLLDAFYAGAETYVHGHSVGGTNPSLLRAMVHGAPVLAFDCPYNRETTGGAATWFSRPDELTRLFKEVEADPVAGHVLARSAQQRACDRYRWSDVVTAYSSLVTDLVAGAAPRRPRHTSDHEVIDLDAPGRPRHDDAHT